MADDDPFAGIEVIVDDGSSAAAPAPLVAPLGGAAAGPSLMLQDRPRATGAPPGPGAMRTGRSHASGGRNVTPAASRSVGGAVGIRPAAWSSAGTT